MTVRITVERCECDNLMLRQKQQIYSPPRRKDIGCISCCILFILISHNLCAFLGQVGVNCGANRVSWLCTIHKTNCHVRTLLKYILNALHFSLFFARHYCIPVILLRLFFYAGCYLLQLYGKVWADFFFPNSFFDIPKKKKKKKGSVNNDLIFIFGWTNPLNLKA